MREILFRGKRIDNNQWIEGTLIATTAVQTKYYIVDSCWCESQRITEKGCADFNWIEAYEVIPETVEQYTGLTDKNGKKIFEGDIVKVYEDIDYRIGVHKSNRKTRTIIGVVVFDEKRFEYQIKNEEYNLTLFRLSKKDTNEVIGNIHDNPELLKGGAE